MSKQDQAPALGYLPTWEIQGRYCPVGPVVQVAVTDQYISSSDVPLNGPEYHEYLHFSQVTPSTWGLLDATLARLPAGNHQRLIEAMHMLAMRQPYIGMMRTLDDSSDAFECLDGILNVHALRSFLGGYPEGSSGSGEFYKDASVLRAAKSFRQMWDVLFPSETDKPWQDLDGRHADLAELPAAPPYPGGITFGASSIHETFACTAQAARGGSIIADALTPERFAAEQNLMRSSDLNDAQRISVAQGAFERLATAMIAPVTDLGAGHPWRAKVTDHTAAKYRAGALFLFQEIRSKDMLEVPLLETALAFCELAVNAPILPAHMPLWWRKPSWFDIHPGYRYTNLCHCLYRLGFAPKMESVTNEGLRKWHEELWEYLDAVCTYMEWPLHSKIVNVNAQPDSRLEVCSDLLGSYQLKVYRQLNSQKIDNLPSVLLARIHENPPPGPSTIIEYLPNGDAEMRLLDGGNGIMSALASTILDEFYFSDDFRLARSLLAGFPSDARRPVADILEEQLAIRGLSQALHPA